MAYIDFLSSLHKKTKRDYLQRMIEFPKDEAIKKAKKFDFDYWDGDRKFGYGGYNYDGRWKTVAQAMVDHYKLKEGDRVLDVGCGKAFLLFELMNIVPNLQINGIDISQYAIANAKNEIRQYLEVGNAVSLPYQSNSFDLVISINTLHNLYCYDLEKALMEIERVGKNNKYTVVESYRNETEKVNLMCWVLTGECFFSPDEWLWWFQKTGYSGDYSFIYFE